MQHRPRRTRPSLLALSLGVLAGLPAALQAQAGPIAGLWRLNVEQSDNLEDKMREGMGGRMPEGGFPRGGGGRGGPRGERRGGGEGGPGGGQRSSMEAFGNAMHPVLQILIKQTDSSMAISDASGQLIAYRVDGKKVTEEQLDGSKIETVSRWKDDRFTIERKREGGGEFHETYAIDPVSKKLILTVKFSPFRSGRMIEARRIYDAATDGA